MKQHFFYRGILIFLFFAAGSYCYGQKEEIYRLAFSDTSNFRIMNLLDHKRPALIRIMDTSMRMQPQRFWLSELDKATPADIRKMELDEHHVYNHSYLFRDTALNGLFSTAEKKQLATRAAQTHSVKLSLSGPNYITLHGSRSIKGFYVVSTEPLFSSDGLYAFIDMLVFNKEKASSKPDDSYYGTIMLVFSKQANGSWKKTGIRSYLIL